MEYEAVTGGGGSDGCVCSCLGGQRRVEEGRHMVGELQA
jgi:hypothetical protein